MGIEDIVEAHATCRPWACDSWTKVTELVIRQSREVIVVDVARPVLPVFTLRTRDLSQADERTFPTISDRLRALKEDAMRVHEALAGIRDFYRAGTFDGDRLRLNDPDLSETERMAAAERLIEKCFPRPVHWARLPVVEPELRRRAAMSGTPVSAELRDAAIQSLLLAIDDIPDNAIVRDFLPIIRSKLNERLTVELAGPEWRHRPAEVPVDEALSDELTDPSRVEDEAEVADLREAIRRIVAGLPKAQRGAVLAKLEGRPLTNANHQAFHRLRQSPPEDLKLLISG